jgi:hypothetical protein
MSGRRDENEEKGSDDSRAPWGRPALRRFAAHEAEGGVHNPPQPDTGKFQGS